MRSEGLAMRTIRAARDDVGRGSFEMICRFIGDWRRHRAVRDSGACKVPAARYTHVILSNQHFIGAPKRRRDSCAMLQGKFR